MTQLIGDSIGIWKFLWKPFMRVSLGSEPKALPWKSSECRRKDEKGLICCESSGEKLRLGWLPELLSNG